MKKEDIANYIDHTLLKADATIPQITKLCDEAKQNGFFSVCVNPSYISFCKNALKGSNVKITTVVGFPLGQNTTMIKVLETTEAIKLGADEIDMVINIGVLKDKNYEFITNEIKLIKQACNQHILKVIIETALLTEEEIIKMCEICLSAGADFIKTSTGFSSRGANLNDVMIMAKHNNNGKLKIKAAGGVKTYDDFVAMVNAGANRIGTSNGIAIIEGNVDKSSGY